MARKTVKGQGTGQKNVVGEAWYNEKEVVRNKAIGSGKENRRENSMSQNNIE